MTATTEDLTTTALPALWRAAPARWGHSLHSLCSYMAMFPPSIPHVFINWLTEVGDVVYDPFSGRGTTVLEARLQGRIAFGADANPLAWVLTAAKAQVPVREAVTQRLKEIRASISAQDPSSEPDRVRMLFSERTLGQLLWLRANLSQDSPVDRFLIAALLGILHANADSAGRPRGLTVAMPNTFSMAPGYVGRFIKAHKLKPPDVDVVNRLESRLEQLNLPEDGLSPGYAFLHDVTQPVPTELQQKPAKLIFCSPPYLQVMKYGKLNWIRLWFLGEDPKKADEKLLSTSSLPRYLDFMSECLSQLRNGLRGDGFMCFVVGDVHRRRGQKHQTINLAEEIADLATSETDLTWLAIIEDELPVRRKVSRIWKENRGRATKTDRILVLAGPEAPPLPPHPAKLGWEFEQLGG